MDYDERCRRLDLVGRERLFSHVSRGGLPGAVLWGTALVLLLTSSAFCQSMEEMGTVALNFLKFRNIPKAMVSSRIIDANQLAPSEAPVPVAWLADLEGGGFILVAASKDLTPVKAYSPNRNYEALPKAYRNYVIAELEWNIRAAAAVRKTTSADATSENGRRWKFLLELQQTRSIESYTPDTYLVTTLWNQGDPYNTYLPKINGQAAWAGCVNVALAQLMRYHKHPQSGKGIASYDWTNPGTNITSTLKALLNRGFNWDNMPVSIDHATPQYQADEVALLIRDLGYANRTVFRLDNSATSLNKEALIGSYGYSNQIDSMTNSNSAFFSTITGEIDGGRPLLIEFPGHLAVADGYSATGAGKCIHVNMGWGGQANSFYFLDQATVEAGSYTFPITPPNLSIIYNVKPCGGSDCDLDRETGDTINGTTITGTFNYGQDVDRYDVYLKGPTTISGTRGFTNQAFFLSLYDPHGNLNLQASDDKALAVDLSSGKYVLRVALCNPQSLTNCYANTTGHQDYTVTITTTAMTDGEKLAADGAANTGPVIGNSFADLLLTPAGASPFRVLVDAANEDNSTITLQATSTNGSAVGVAFTKNVLELTPLTSAKVASKITATAASGGKTAEKSFTVLLSDEQVGFGTEFRLTGTFLNQDTYNTHAVILDGTCTITGITDYYGTQVFFSSVIDAQQNTVVAENNTQISHLFARNRYSITASLCQGHPHHSSCYSFGTDVQNYEFLVTCPDASTQVEVIAPLLGVDLSGTVDPATTLLLNQGWNFVSLRRQPNGGTVETQLGAPFLSKVHVIWGFDNQSQAWRKFVPSGSANTLTALQAGPGYWVYMDSTATLDISAWSAQQVSTVHLYDGWNLVGYYGQDNRDITSGLGSPVDGRWSAIWKWENGAWYLKHETVHTLPAPIQSLTTLNQGKAYWIRIKPSLGPVDWAQ